ncbi:MAG TPA: valine--tRNA ligase [Actinomycetota bacterium]|nr:valine--tRNA ligase [Actinomycetota bacterium]
MTDLPKQYEPEGVEGRWYSRWREAGYFAGQTGAEGEPFCVVIPPPNVTGILHMGHALNNTLQDVFVRRARMQGRPTLWVPGTDHAGIATQNVVEKRLATEEGLTRHDLGREAFLERVWAWKDTYESRILGQLERLGCSCDWDRTRFTMDADLSRAVRTVFVRLFEEGRIYRGNRIINWCPRCTTALSDIEVVYSDRDGELVTIRYPLSDGSGHISVSTTRVETMLGDTGVAVHPQDDRYRHLIGRTVTLPLVGREIPIVADEAVEPGFGTGAVKITPAHDPTDFEIGERQGLDQVNIFDGQARVNANGGRFEGMDRYEARKAVREALAAEGLIEREERPYIHSVGHCERCQTVVEPWLSEQWFVSMRELAAPAIDAVRSGRVRLMPERFTKVYLDWMENIRDWCISRQLWWGHRVPVWYCPDGHATTSITDPDACATCGSREITQDPDVLDTWFSSWLWPISTLGWPDDTDDLRYWYPTTLLVTGYDILFFWVARMIMAGLHFGREVPFGDVLLTGLVRDWEGKKMSKSLGNQIDPLDLIDRYGTDAVRFTLCRAMTPGTDMNLNEDWIEGSRHFVNKLWNASRFVLHHVGAELPPRPEGELDLGERWILSRLAQTQAAVDGALDAFETAEAARTLHQFVWSEFCDWYVEMSKLALADPARAPAARWVLHHVLERTLRLLHPVMPFVTEEIWQRLPREDGSVPSIMLAPWPGVEGALDAEAEEAMSLMQDVIVEIRRFRHEHSIPPRARMEAVAVAPQPAAGLLDKHRGWVESLAWLEALRVDGPMPGPGWSRIVAGPAEVWLPLAAVGDVEAERARLHKAIDEAEAKAERSRAKLADDGFVTRAPAEVVQRVREQLSELEERIAKMRVQLSELGG